MEQEKQRNQNLKFWLSGLVVCSIHSEQGTKAAAESRDCQQGGFPNSPMSGFGVVLIQKHNQESGCIDYYQVGKNKVIHKNSSFREALS